MKGQGTSHGAATIVSAFATGKGAAFGIDLTTTAEVVIEEGTGVEVIIDGTPDESPALAQECARAVLERYADGDRHVRIITRSDIPVSRGLKSSSAAANAIIADMLDALGMEHDELDAVRMGARAAVRAGVSVTGAFDDACAARFGGVFLTDNTADSVLARDVMPDLAVFIHVPERQIRKASLPRERMAAVGGIVKIAFQLAERRDYLRALTLNGLCYSAALGLDADIAVRALQSGALSAGLTGSGPATVMLVEPSRASDFQREMEGCKLMRANVINDRSIT